MANRRSKYRLLKELHRCPHCREELPYGYDKVLCPVCLEKNRERYTASVARMRALNPREKN